MRKMKFWGIALPVLIGMIVFSCEQKNDLQTNNEKSGSIDNKNNRCTIPF